MELHWPLILFTFFVAWASGLFASQCVLLLKGEGKKAQIPALACSMGLLAVGGISVFFHLQHWDRIFNGFGHLSSPITQELICVVLLVIAAVVLFAFLRKEEVPSAVCVVGIVIAVIMVAVMAHSYMMASRPTWNSFGWILAVLGNACVLGPATMMLLLAFAKDESQTMAPKLALIGGGVNAVTTILYLLLIMGAASQFSSVEYWVDPTRPAQALLTAGSFSPFAGENMLPSMIAIVAALAAAGVAFAGSKNSKIALPSAGACLALAVIAAIAVRIVFFQTGASVFMLF